MKRAGLIAAIVAGLFLDGSGAAEEKEAVLPAKLRPQAEEAQKYFTAGRWSEAVRTYEAMQKAAPDNLWVLSNLAVVQMRMKQFKQAEETLRAALVLAPGDGFCRRMLGIVCYSQKKYDEAVAELTKAAAIDPKDAEAHLYLAFCAAEKGLTEVAEKQFDRAAKLHPEFKVEPGKGVEGDRHWPVGDYLTPLERSRLRLPPMPLIR
jgi:tetratricopeptide (TPR) repeat protein